MPPWPRMRPTRMCPKFWPARLMAEETNLIGSVDRVLLRYSSGRTIEYRGGTDESVPPRVPDGRSSRRPRRPSSVRGVEAESAHGARLSAAAEFGAQSDAGVPRPRPPRDAFGDRGPVLQAAHTGAERVARRRHGRHAADAARAHLHRRLP